MLRFVEGVESVEYCKSGIIWKFDESDEDNLVQKFSILGSYDRKKFKGLNLKKYKNIIAIFANFPCSRGLFRMQKHAN